jgi:hypothetical protein
MNLEDIYAYDFPETLVGLEKQCRQGGFRRQMYLPSVLQIRAMEEEDDEMDITPDSFGKEDFDNRLPSFGWTDAQIDEILSTAAQSEMHEFVCF